jgi:hypothetical protein
LAIVFFSQVAVGQITGLYSFSETTGTYTPLTGGTLSTASGDDGEQTNVPIGFTFIYDQQNYTTLTIGVNGGLSFTLTDISYANQLASTSKKPVLAPLWDDLYLRSSDNGKIYYKTEGVSPNRTFTVEWRNISWRVSGDTVNFQVVLEETTNKIYFKYGPNYAVNNSRTASIGINDHTGGSGHFISVVPGSPATTSSTTATDSLSSYSYPGNGKIYVFTYTPPTCPTPTSAVTTNVTTTSAIVNWTENGSATQWDIEYGPTGFTHGNGIIVNTTNKPDTLTGLNSGTTYQWYVRARCGANDSSTWLGPINFTTNCAPVSTLPWLESFESLPTTGNGNVPVCMSEIGDWYSANTSLTRNRQAHTGTHYIYTNYSADDWLISPAFNLNAGTSYDFSFYYITDGLSGWTTVETKIGNYQNKDSLTTTVGTPVSGPNNTTWIKYTATFTPSTTGLYYVGIHVVANSSPWYITFDDLSLEVSPTCPAPTALTVSGTTSTSAIVGWTETGSATQWDIEYGPTGFTHGTGTKINTNSNPDTLTNLNPGTAYEWYVRAKCSATDSSSWSGPSSFTTDCVPVTSLPWNEDFESLTTTGTGIVPVCMAETGDWGSANTPMSYKRKPHSGTNYVYTKYSADDWLFTPGFNLSAGSTYRFSFYYSTDGNSGWTTVEAKMGNFQSGDSMTVAVGTPLSSPSDTFYQQYTGTITVQNSGVYYFAIHVSANSSPWYISFDDLSLTPVLSFSGLASAYCSDATPVTLTGNPAGGTFYGAGIIGNTFYPAKAMADTNIIAYSIGSQTVFDTTVITIAPKLKNIKDTSVCAGDTITFTAETEQIGGVFFSEYIEGSSNNKALEIYNGTGKTISLDKYSIVTNYNGNPWSGQYHFPAGTSLANGDVFVIVNQNAKASMLAVADDTLAYNQGGYVVGFNGDDVRALYYHKSSTDSVMIDVIGHYNLTDPGNGWNVAGVANATKDHSLVRKSTVLKGDTIWSSIAGIDSLTSQYLVFPKDSVNTLGSHTIMQSSFAYLWNTGATTPSISVTPSTTASYSVIVSNGNCQDNDTVDVTVNTIPQVSITGPDTLCNTSSAVLDAGAGFKSYNWSTNATTQTTTVDSNNLKVGDNNVWVMVTDNNGCKASDTIKIYLDDCLGINKIKFQGVVKIYPNPSNGRFSVLFDGVNGKTIVEISDITGRIITRSELDIMGKTIQKYNLAEMPHGLYQIRVINNNSSRQIKIIVQ